MLLFTTVMVNDSGTPGAVVVELPKLLRMSLRTIPLDDSTLLTAPLTELEPSDGYGPFVSVGSAMRAVVPLEELLAEDELLLLDEELLEELPLSFELPPQAARKAAAPPEASQPNIWRKDSPGVGGRVQDERGSDCTELENDECRTPHDHDAGLRQDLELIQLPMRQRREAFTKDRQRLPSQ